VHSNPGEIQIPKHINYQQKYDQIINGDLASGQIANRNWSGKNVLKNQGKETHIQKIFKSLNVIDHQIWIKGR
jgi:hypothetical protein